MAPAPQVDDRGVLVEVKGLDFRYPGASQAALRDIRLTLTRGSRCVLIGRNGAGKTTLLRVLAGRHMVPEETVRVLGRPAFHDTSLAGRVAYLGGRFPFRIDVTVAEILTRTPAPDPHRRERLVEILGVDRAWHMDRVSDGQRRRVQLLLGLMRPMEVLFLDEVMSDLDLGARADLLELLRRETDERGVALLYATHILGELDDWATHVAYLEEGRLVRHAAVEAIPELTTLRQQGIPAALRRFALDLLRQAPRR